MYPDLRIRYKIFSSNFLNDPWIEPSPPDSDYISDFYNADPNTTIGFSVNNNSISKKYVNQDTIEEVQLSQGIMNSDIKMGGIRIMQIPMDNFLAYTYTGSYILFHISKPAMLLLS